ncbi:MAG: SLC13 family permease [Thermoleophilia bacterium]|nr:SLC13 family permease [Thermoleophilia bacterium]
MSLDAWIAAAVIVSMLLALAFELMPPAATVLTATVSLLVLGVIDEEQALSGFSNPAPLTVAALYVLAYAADKTGLLGPLVNRMLGKQGKVDRKSLARLTMPAAGISAFINNTPLVAMMIGQVTTWCKQRGVSPSLLLLPISYAAILGGTLTVIGTSTNLVASGLLEATGEPAIGMFEITRISLFSATAGILVLVFLVPRLLPERRAAVDEFTDEMREFTVQMEVIEGGPLDGSTISEAGLRNLKGIFLVEIQREGVVLPAVSPSRSLGGGDRLTFAGDSDSIVSFQRTAGLKSAEDQHMLAIDSPEHTFFEAVVGADSRLVGQTLRDLRFRGRYQAAVVALHRAGIRIDSGLGRLELESGDTLLLLAGPDFRARSRRGRDFLLVTRLGGPPPSATRRAPLVGLVAVAVVALAAFEVMSILQAALIAAGFLIATRTISFSEAGEAIDFGVILLIASAFGIGAAMQSTGLAENIATGLLDLFGGLGDLGIIFGLALATVLLTEVITNNAAIVVVFPIAIAIAVGAGLDPRIIAMMVAVVASSSFLTPMGYQTNTMVYGPGGYRFSDYVRAGLPVTAVVLVTATLSAWAFA